MNQTILSPNKIALELGSIVYRPNKPKNYDIAEEYRKTSIIDIF